MRPGRRQIESAQLEGLRALLPLLSGNNPFYAAKLARAGLGGPLASLEEFSARMPFTTKPELVEDQLAHPPYGTGLTFPLESYTRYCQTSGTTGRPLRWLDTNASWSWMLGCWDRVYAAAAVNAADRVFFPFSFGPFLGFWAAFEAATRLGCLAIPGGGMSSPARLRTILDNAATVLCSTPTYAIRLAEVAAAEGFDLSASRVRRIIVAGEPGGAIPATRVRIEALWPGARVVDHHGMTEIGPVSYECPRRRGVLHIIEPQYYPEVVDPRSLDPAGPGGSGELVLTNLGRTGSPLLRYRTGDMVRLAADTECACGSGEMALDGGILGRCDDMLVVRGVNIYPSAVEEILRSCGADEYLAEVRFDGPLPDLRIQVETGRRDLPRKIEAALRDAYALRVSVSPVAPGSLPRLEGKSRRWIRASGQSPAPALE